MGIVEYFSRKCQIYRAKSKVKRKTPGSILELKKKYNFSEFNRINTDSAYGHTYVLDENRVGKVLRKEQAILFFHKMDIFDKIREEYVAQRVANELGLPVIQAYELVLAENNETKRREVMIVMEYGGKKRLKEEDDSLEILKKLNIAEDKILKYISNEYMEVDTGAHNAFWNELERKVTLFDCDGWKF